MGLLDGSFSDNHVDNENNHMISCVIKSNFAISHKKMSRDLLCQPIRTLNSLKSREIS